MKIAVAAMGHTVAGHFGHCENFIFFDVEDNKIVDEKSVPNPGHRPGFLPNFLADNGAEVIIVGAQGDAKDCVEAWLKGELKSTGAVCHEHAHEGNCNG